MKPSVRSFLFRYSVAILALCAFSALGACRANPVGGLGGSARVFFSLGGVLPPKAGSGGQASAARLVSPTTASVRISAVDGTGKRAATTTAYSSGGSASLGGLPTDQPLVFSVEALDSSGGVVSAWTGTQTLAAADTTLSVVLKPDEAAVTMAPALLYTGSGGGFTLAAPPSIPIGGTVFYRMQLNAADSSCAGTCQILYDTDRAEWAWMGVYDQDWKALSTVCADQEQGWAVVDFPVGTTMVNIALANSVSSPGYPSRALSGHIELRHARFCAPGAAGAGTPGDPMNLADAVANGESRFIKGGSYTTTAKITTQPDENIYGGFSSDWANRNAPTSIAAAAASGDTFALEVSGDARIDGITVAGRALGSSNSDSGAACLNGADASVIVVSNCVLEGGDGSISGGSASLQSYGARAENGHVELSSCTIEGGSASLNAGGGFVAVSAGLVVNPNTSLAAYIHDCDIAAGTAAASGASSAICYGLLNMQTPSTIADCRIWGGCASSATTAATSGLANIASIPGNRITVASCLISGGTASASGTSAISYGVDNAGYGLYLGCVMHSGTASGGTANQEFAAYEEADGSSYTGASLFGCACFCSATSGDTSAPFNEKESGGGFTALTGNVGFSASDNFYKAGETHILITDSSADPNDTSVDKTRAPAQELKSYSAPQTFEAFKGDNWSRAAGAAYVGAAPASSATPASWGIAASLFSDYPALGLDLAGKARGRDSDWHRGAYQ